MAKLHFTKKRLENLPYPKQGCDEYTDDTTPLWLRVTKNCKSYTCRFSIKGKKIRMTIAQFGEITLEEAREKAQKLQWQAKRGTLKLPNENRRKRISFKEFSAERMVIRAKQKKSLDAIKNDEGRLRIHIIPSLGASKRMRDITLADIKKLWENVEFGVTAQKIIEKYERDDRKAKKEAEQQGIEYKPNYRSKPKGGHEAARSCHALLSAILQDAVQEGLIDRNPTRDFVKPKRQKSSKIKYLTKPEIVMVGQALKEIDKYNPMALCILQLLLLTGCRYGEIATLRWEDIDYDSQCINFETSKTGAKRTFIGKIVVDILQDIQHNNGSPKTGYVFPSNIAGRYYNGTQRIWKRIRKSLDIEKRIHDFRHTFASAVAEAGKNPQIVSALLGHSNRSMTDHYTHFAKDSLIEAADEVTAIIAEQLDLSDKATAIEDNTEDTEVSTQMDLPF